MKKLLLPLIASFSFTAYAQTFHVSPEVKIGAYNGAGIQLGVADTLGMDAVFFSYARKTYDTSRYDETIDSYRIGLQHMFGDRENYGLQAEIGVANYNGDKKSGSEWAHRSATGLSISASYVYMLNPAFGLKTGFDYDVFGAENTFISLDNNFTLNFGVVARF
ncbi:hypothetical protein [Vibrio hangzhouensis]|uniref:Outer membrane protein beta-barrel domain-containing protein n=1 Tax=Vibrio hangzhouensis TaxID=462991 RepID=A0A1H6AH71_9VIBR|nr:hypothetical protein [Vibrio hangzhouensis]SEG48113.1 hypothetical protein SAMN04488244_115103 [Vibrio hangzhouensis]